MLEKNVENGYALTANQIESLNKHYNEWLKVNESKLLDIQHKMRNEFLSAPARLEALETIQSVYRSYLENVQPLAENTKWRRIIDRADGERSANSLSQIQDMVFSRELFEFYRGLLERAVNSGKAELPESAEFLHPQGLKASLSKLRIKRTFTRIRDLNRKVFESLVHLAVETIGVTSDRFPLRAGKLYNRPEVTSDIIQTLQPMDLLLDRANRFKISHMIIPGYYGHAGIYLGTKEQLIKIGMWDHPAIVLYHSAIENGQVMLEAKRTGVKLRTLREYLNTDSITALRQRNLTNESLGEKMTRGLEKIGKHFDHTFTLEHSESFFCTKLIYFVFNNIPWTSTKIAGRTALPPDYIAAMSMGEKRYFDPVLVYEAGEKVTGDLQEHIERVQRQVP